MKIAPFRRTSNVSLTSPTERESDLNVFELLGVPNFRYGNIINVSLWYTTYYHLALSPQLKSILRSTKF